MGESEVEREIYLHNHWNPYRQYEGQDNEDHYGDDDDDDYIDEDKYGVPPEVNHVSWGEEEEEERTGAGVDSNSSADEWEGQAIMKGLKIVYLVYCYYENLMEWKEEKSMKH